MDKNLLWAIGLSALVYIGWYGFVDKAISPPGASRPAAAAAKGPAAATAPAGRQPAPLPSGKGEPQPSGNAAPTAGVDRETLIKESRLVSLGDAQAWVHPRGAGIVSCRYRGPLGSVELVEDPAPGLLASYPDLIFEPAGPSAWRARRADGMVFLKEFQAGSGGSLSRVRMTIANESRESRDTGPWTLSLGPGLGTVPSEAEENPKVWRSIGLTKATSGTRGKIDVFKTGAVKDEFRWLAVDNRYFLAAVLAPGSFDTMANGSPPRLTLTAKGRTLAPNESASWEVPFYIGPKANNTLEQFGEGLERSIDFGFFAQIGRFILRLLGRLYTATGNWGWSIILLTLLLQTVLFPLTYKSLKSAAAMRRLQPQMAKLQQQFGKDPQRLNQEMMELYKRTGANPLGGCLPLLVQMPVFIALYNTLRNAWELHGAVWVLWVRDLSAKDPYYVLPIIMGGVMFFQNKMNPTPTADPIQAKMMLWMPVLFTFMFLNFPSGLVLYWLTNSLVSVAQQMALKQHFERMTT